MKKCLREHVADEYLKSYKEILISTLYPTPAPPAPAARCFIATAAYGTPLAEEVEILRRFRDEYLFTNEWGRRFVTFYYRHSPALAEFISRREWAKRGVRIALWPIVEVAEL